MTDSRCHRCDRAECPNHPPVTDHGTDIGPRSACPGCIAADDCAAHAVDWRTRALAAEQRAEVAEAREARLRETIGNVRTCLIAFDQHVAVTSGTVGAADLIAASTAFVRRVRSFLSKHDTALAPAAESGKETP